MRLWVHETMRVFHDRLNNPEDRLFYKTAVHAMCRTRFAYQGDLHDLFDATPIIFANFLAIGAAEEDRLYEEVGNPSGLPKLLGDYQEEYNHAAGSRWVPQAQRRVSSCPFKFIFCDVVAKIYILFSDLGFGVTLRLHLPAPAAAAAARRAWCFSRRRWTT
jgi:hypothetical protein